MFMAGEADRRCKKAPTQVMEVLAQENLGVISLPGHSEISSFVGSLISRSKKGKTGLPKAKAAPTTAVLTAEIEALDVQGLATGRLNGDKHTKASCYEELKNRHTKDANGVSILEADFPSKGRVDTLITNQRKARRPPENGGEASSGNLLRLVTVAARVNSAGDPPSSKVGSKFFEAL
jgi:hypothetical protein